MDMGASNFHTIRGAHRAADTGEINCVRSRSGTPDTPRLVTAEETNDPLDADRRNFYKVEKQEGANRFLFKEIVGKEIRGVSEVPETERR
jgi:hypothetical protein